jgi:hypothetical protein
MVQGNLRHFRVTPTKPYYEARAKYNAFTKTYWENPNHVSKPYSNLKSLQIKQSDNVKTLMTDTNLPYGISNQLPVVKNSRGSKRKLNMINNGLFSQLERQQHIKYPLARITSEFYE